MQKTKIAIIGSGPAGYTAAMYAARAQLEPVVYEGFYSGPPGGQLMTTTDVENYPGFPDGVMGPMLMDAFKKQAIRFNAQMRSEDVYAVDFSKRPFEIFGKKERTLADAVIVATGATAKRLYVPGTHEGEFWQKGVSACAVCDGAMPIFRDKHLFVIGGGDTAMEEALFLTKYAAKVVVVHRRDTFRASKVLAERALNHEKIEVIWNHVLEGVEGDAVVTDIVLRDVITDAVRRLPAGGVFFGIGHKPNTDFLAGQIALHENGYVAVEPGTTKTSLRGVFAAGDVQDSVYRQAVTAAGTGCMAALEAEHYLASEGLV